MKANLQLKLNCAGRHVYTFILGVADSEIAVECRLQMDELSCAIETISGYRFLEVLSLFG